jgi:hypothetical protein
MKHIISILVVMLALAACGKSDDKKGGSAGGNVTGGCHSAAAGDCWEHPAGRDPKLLADICDNDPNAKWVAACPREGLVGGCKSSNKYDKGAPTHFFYKGTADEIRKTCEANSELFVAK